MSKQRTSNRIESFGFVPGLKLSNNKYEVVTKLGEGWESEVYMLREIKTGIERAAKFFFPHRNVGEKSSTKYAKKLHKLRDCPIVIRYFTQEKIVHKDRDIVFLISDYVEGECLSDFLSFQPGGRLQTFEALHLLYEVAKGLECVHDVGEYHGDLHMENIIVRRKGLGFEAKILDPFNWGNTNSGILLDDICNLIKIFYDAIGGTRFYSKQKPEVKAICCGLKRSLIAKKFKNAGDLCYYLENIQWSDNSL